MRKRTENTVEALGCVIVTAILVALGVAGLIIAILKLTL